MDKRKGVLNILTSIVSRVLLLVIALYVRRLLILCVGNDMNGLNALFGSIIGMLAVAELGVGSAIVYSMYRPIVEGDERKVAALYCLYRKLYRIIGGVIFAGGLAVMPFLPRLISDYDTLDVNVYLTFFLTLIASVLSYLYSAKTSLIEAHKDNYITTAIVTSSRLLRYGLQIIVLLLWKSFVLFLICQIIETIIVWIATEIAVQRLHPGIVRMREKLDDGTKNEVTRNVKAMFMHKLGAILVGAVDSMVISAFIGIVILGKYSNYIAIVSAMTGIISLIFSPLTSVIGHYCAANEPGEIKRHFNHFYSINYILGMVFFLGFYAVIDNLILILFGPGLELVRTVAFMVTLNQFISYMRNAQLLFRDATGTFYYDRWKPLAEGLSNLVLSVLLVKVLPEEYSVIGVIAATVITSLLICDTVEPHIVFKYVFKESAKLFYIRNYCGIALFAFCMIIMEKLYVSTAGNLAGVLANGAISLGISAATLLLLALIDKRFRMECRVLFMLAANWRRKRVAQ